MIRFRSLAAVVVSCVAIIALTTSSASAKRHHHYRHYSHHHSRHIVDANGSGVIGGRPAGCPHRYCGCGVSIKVFGHQISGLNLAANWGRFPRTAPTSGMVAYRSGHVFYIEYMINSYTAMAYDPNSGGGATRVHPRSISGYHVVNPHGGRYALN